MEAVSLLLQVLSSNPLARPFRLTTRATLGLPAHAMLQAAHHEIRLRFDLLSKNLWTPPEGNAGSWNVLFTGAYRNPQRPTRNTLSSVNCQGDSSSLNCEVRLA